jgi:RHS repeat-associated protein
MNPTGGAPTLSVSVALDQNNVPNNRITASGVSYDNNGNLTLGFGNIGPEYDAANRVSQVWMNGQPNTYYGYDPDNHRVYSGGTGHGADTIYLYGVDGKKLATYTTTFTGSYPLYKMQLNCQSDNVYFGGRLVSAEGNLVRTDRLGSVRAGGPGGLGYQAQYPYGVEYTTTANDREKYATYTRDSLTGFDYAVNRYYSSQWGRFLSPDPYMADSGGAGDLRDPGSWNRYAYALNEPVSLYDPAGLFACSGDGEDQYRFGGAACFAGAGGDGPPQRPMSDSDQPGGGGGGPSANIASRTPPALVSAFQRAFREAWSVLQTDPNCAGSLVNQPAESSAASYVTGVLADTTYRIMPFGLGMSAVGAQTNEDGSVFINQTGAFFTLQPNASGNVTFNIPSPTTGRWVAVTLPQVDFQAFIILHETGHETGVFGPDQNPVVNGQHSWDVLENCFGLQAPTTLAPPPLSPHP